MERPAAKRRYQDASAEFNRLLAIRDDLGNKTDDAVALRQAIQLQSAATGEYSDALRELSDFVLRRGATRTGAVAVSSPVTVASKPRRRLTFALAASWSLMTNRG